MSIKFVGYCYGGLKYLLCIFLINIYRCLLQKKDFIR